MSSPFPDDQADQDEFNYDEPDHDDVDQVDNKLNEESPISSSSDSQLTPEPQGVLRDETDDASEQEVPEELTVGEVSESDAEPVDAIIPDVDIPTDVGPRIDALSGEISPWGDQTSDEAGSDLSGPTISDVLRDDTISESLLSLMRDLSGQDAAGLAGVVASPSCEQLLQWIWVASRDRYASTGSTDEHSLMGGTCLAAIGSHHGDGLLGRVCSGDLSQRDPIWPVVPSVLHAAADTLAARIDASTAMVLLTPLDYSHGARPLAAETLRQIRAACDEQGAALVIDHTRIPPQGQFTRQSDGESVNGFWLHEAIAGVRADAVLMSAGLTPACVRSTLAELQTRTEADSDLPENDDEILNVGRTSMTTGGLLCFGERLAESLDRILPAADVSRRLAEAMFADALDECLQQQVFQTDCQKLPTLVAQRLAVRDMVRDLHATGHTLGIELDVPADQWIRVARAYRLRVARAGDFAVRMQLPLVMTDEQTEQWMQRLDRVLTAIETSEQETVS